MSSLWAPLAPGPKLWLADLSTFTAPCGAELMRAHPISLVRASSVKSLRRSWLRLGGISRMCDDLETSLRGRAVHAWRAGNNIELAALSKLADSHSHSESREAVASLELRPAIIEKPQGS